MRARRACDWDGFYVLGGSHLSLRYLYLHLVAHSRSWVSPVVGRNEAARPGSGDHCLSDLIGRCTKLAGHDPVDVDIHCRIMERLFVAEITQRRNFCQLLLYFAGVAQHIVVLRTSRCDLNYRRSAEVEDLAYEVSRIKREVRSWNFLRQRLPQLLLSVVNRNGRARLKGDIQDCFVWSARPQKHGIDWI